MKLFIICSKKFYNRIPMIKEVLEENGHQVVLPNSYDKPYAEDEIRLLGEEEHIKFKTAMYKQSEETIKNVDGVLVINLSKNNHKNYIGGATFLEMYDAFRMQKDIYLYNSIPKGILTDEIVGFNPIVIDGNLNNIPNINKVQTNILKTLSDEEFKTINEISQNLNIDFDICERELNALYNAQLVTNEDMMDLYKATDLGKNHINQYNIKKLKKN